MEIVKSLHVKFFSFGSVEPVGSVTVKDRPLSDGNVVQCNINGNLLCKRPSEIIIVLFEYFKYLP